MRSLSFASADRSMGQATRLTAGYGYSSTHGFKEPFVVTADPLTLSLRFAAMGELKHSFKKEAKHSFKYALLKLLMRIRSWLQA